MYGNGEYIMRSNVVKSRQTSAFESKTTRSELISSERLLGPGPGTYSIPSAISVKKKDPALQCFDTLEMRFREVYSLYTVFDHNCNIFSICNTIIYYFRRNHALNKF